MVQNTMTYYVSGSSCDYAHKERTDATRTQYRICQTESSHLI